MQKLTSVNSKVYSHKVNSEVIRAIPLNTKTLLDLGCGKGENGLEIAKSRSTILDAVTISLEELNAVKEIYKNVYLFNLEEGLPNIDSKYDCILCSHLLEHIAYPEKLLKAIHSQLADDGTLVVALPNLLNYKSRLQLLLGNFNYQKQGTWDFTHLRWYTFKTGEQLLIDNGFIVIRAWVTGDLPLLTLTKIIPKSFRQSLFKVLSKISPGFFGNQLLYIATKK